MAMKNLLARKADVDVDEATDPPASTVLRDLARDLSAPDHTVDEARTRLATIAARMRAIQTSLGQYPNVNFQTLLQLQETQALKIEFQKLEVEQREATSAVKDAVTAMWNARQQRRETTLRTAITDLDAALEMAARRNHQVRMVMETIYQCTPSEVRGHHFAANGPAEQPFLRELLWPRLEAWRTFVRNVFGARVRQTQHGTTE